MKIFLSSTAFDLGDIRSLAVEIINEFGHEPLYHESPTFPARTHLHSHDQCLAAVEDSDVIAAIIDKRYGGLYAGAMSYLFRDQTFELTDPAKTKFTATVGQMSISWLELLRAEILRKPMVTFAREKTVFEQLVRRKNQSVPSFIPAHVNDERVFNLLDWIHRKPTDNWIAQFRDAADFRHKFRAWVKELDGSYLPPSGVVSNFPGPSSPSGGGLMRITVLVEGEMDRLVLKALFRALDLSAAYTFVATQGASRIPESLKLLVNTISIPSDAIVVILDGQLVGSLKETILRQVGENVHVVVASPGIDQWLAFALNYEFYLRGMGAHLKEEQPDTDVAKLNVENLLAKSESFRELVQLLRSLEANWGRSNERY